MDAVKRREDEQRSESETRSEKTTGILASTFPNQVSEPPPHLGVRYGGCAGANGDYGHGKKPASAASSAERREQSLLDTANKNEVVRESALRCRALETNQPCRHTPLPSHPPIHRTTQPQKTSFPGVSVVHAIVCRGLAPCSKAGQHALKCGKTSNLFGYRISLIVIKENMNILPQLVKTISL